MSAGNLVIMWIICLPITLLSTVFTLIVAWFEDGNIKEARMFILPYIIIVSIGITFVTTVGLDDKTAEAYIRSIIERISK